MTAAAIPPALPCPVCGRAPRLVEWFAYGPTGALCWARYECVRWLGLRVHLCARPCANREEWRDLLEPRAREAWRLAVEDRRA